MCQLEFPKTLRNNLAESTLLVKANIFKLFHFPFSPLFSENFGAFVIFGDVLISRPNFMSETETGPNLSQIHNPLPFHLSEVLIIFTIPTI